MLGIGGAQPQQLIIYGTAQGLLYGPGGEKTHPGSANIAAIAHSHGQQCDCRRQQQLPGVNASLLQRRQQAGDGPHHCNVCGKCAPLQRNVSRNVLSALGHGADEPFVEHHMVLSCLFVSSS